jgi:tetratricopeptide (TPR) repeat protein
LTSDPRETTNLYARDGERARTLEALLRDMTARLAPASGTVEQTKLDADARQRLQALGYIATAAAPGRRTYRDADDPKVLIGPANDLNRAIAMFQAGARREAMDAVRAVAAAHPSFSTAYGVFASMQHDSGDLGGAIATLEDAVRRGLADQSVMVVLAGYLQEGGALDKSAALLEAVVAAHPDYADAWNSLGVAYSRMARHDRARAAFRTVLDLDPTAATAYENLGVDALGAGELDAAADALQKALAIDPSLARAHNALAAVRLRQGRKDEALAEWTEAVRLDPRLFDALYNLGTVLYDSGRRAEARPYLERFVNEAPPERYAADIAKLRGLLRQ